MASIRGGKYYGEMGSFRASLTPFMTIPGVMKAALLEFFMQNNILEPK